MNIWLLIYFILGIICGIVIGILACCSVLARRWLAGALRYTEVEGESQPYLSLDLDKYPEDFKNNKYVVFKMMVQKLDVDKPPQK